MQCSDRDCSVFHILQGNIYILYKLSFLSLKPQTIPATGVRSNFSGVGGGGRMVRGSTQLILLNPIF